METICRIINKLIITNKWKDKHFYEIGESVFLRLTSVNKTRGCFEELIHKSK